MYMEPSNIYKINVNGLIFSFIFTSGISKWGIKNLEWKFGCGNLREDWSENPQTVIRTWDAGTREYKAVMLPKVDEYIFKYSIFFLSTVVLYCLSKTTFIT